MYGIILQLGQSLLLQARETLAEVPGQFIEYMKKRGIKPNPPVSRPPQLEQQRPQSNLSQPQQPAAVATAPYPPPQTAPYPTQQPPSYSAATVPDYHSRQFTPQHTYPQSTVQ